MKKNYQIKSILFLAFLFVFIKGLAQTHKHHTSDTHEFKQFRTAITIGHGHMPTASNEGTKFLVMPTWGLDFQFFFNKKWAIGIKSDLEIANYVIEDKEHENKLERENPFILTLPIFYCPWEQNGWTFFLGPGIEFEESHNIFVFRTGVGYEIHLPNNWDVAPDFIYDIKGDYGNSFTIALGIGKKF